MSRTPTDVKNTAPFAVCLPTGRTLAPGETGEADTSAHDVSDLVERGYLTPVQADADKPAAKSKES